MSRLVAPVVMVALLVGACGTGESAGPTVAIDEDVEFSLARACVVGGEEQVLEVRGPHHAVAIFEAVYADGQNGAPPPYGGGYGGHGSEFLPESEVIEMPWTLSPEAPPGDVVVRVSFLRGEEPETEELTFTLAGPEESCP